MKFNDDIATYPSGQTSYFPFGVVAIDGNLNVLSATPSLFFNDPSKLTQQVMQAFNGGYLNSGISSELYSQEDRIALADYMISQWTKYKESVS